MGKKINEREWEQATLEALPYEPDEKLRRYAKKLEEIKPPLIIWARESVPDPDDWQILNCFGSYEIGGRNHWGAVCRCTECGESFTAGYKNKQILLLQMEDGNLLDGWTDGEEPETVSFDVSGNRREDMTCPMCGTEGHLIKRSSINGRSLTVQIAELTNIGTTTVILYWLATRWLDKTGYGPVTAVPRCATVLSPSGRVIRYGTGTEGKWKKIGRWNDPETIPYCEGGGFYMKSTGAYMFCNVEDMTGTTGEKTAIDTYFKAKNTLCASSYLKIWSKHRTIEALVKTGGAAIASDYVRARMKYSYSKDMAGMDLREKKPHRILGVGKEDYRFIVSHAWALRLVGAFKDYRKIFPKTTAAEFTAWGKKIDPTGIDYFTPFFSDGLGRICGYIEKQKTDAVHYLDYRRMLKNLCEMTERETELTQEEKFPRDLRTAHDRVSDALTAIRIEQEKIGTQKERRTFAEMKKKYAPLEWKNGEYCIVIPESPAELVREGAVLHHCVGGYASQHCRGQMIFFVRHARRPERSWFTLNEDVNGSKVHRIQLHGYGNEYAHGKRLTIPKEVTDFVQAWETDVLAPYLLKNNRRTTA